MTNKQEDVDLKVYCPVRHSEGGFAEGFPDSGVDVTGARQVFAAGREGDSSGSFVD